MIGHKVGATEILSSEYIMTFLATYVKFPGPHTVLHVISNPSSPVYSWRNAPGPSWSYVRERVLKRIPGLNEKKYISYIPISITFNKIYILGNFTFYFELCNLNTRNKIWLTLELTFLPVAPRQQEASDFKTAGFSDTLNFYQVWESKEKWHEYLRKPEWCERVTLNGIIITTI